MTALDFSYARPGGAALTANGVTAVGRYLGTDGRCITLAELSDYLNNGISVWFIKENSSRGMLNGYAQGLSDAQAAQEQLNILGYPNAAVYYTADFDIQDYQYTAGDNYLKGVASVTPVERIGLYAGNAYLNHAAGLYTYGWKTASSSFDHGQTANAPVHLIQTTDTPPIPNTDYDLIMVADYGQINRTNTAGTGTTNPIEEDDMFTDADRQLLAGINERTRQLEAAVIGIIDGVAVGLNPNVNFGQSVIYGLQEARKGVQQIIDTTTTKPTTPPTP